MPTVSLEKNWGRANLAITLTTPALDLFFIQLNPDRGKTKGKHTEEPRRTPKENKSLGMPSWSLVGIGTGNVWYLIIVIIEQRA